MESVNFFGLAAQCWMTDMMQEDQTAFYKWISQWFLYCSTRLRHSCPQTCTHTDRHLHKCTHTHTQAHIRTLAHPGRSAVLLSHNCDSIKLVVKDNQAPQLAPLTFPPLSSPLYSVSSLCLSRPKFFCAPLLLPFFSDFFSYVAVYFFLIPLTNIFLYLSFLLFHFFFLRIHSVLIHSILYTILVEP